MEDGPYDFPLRGKCVPSWAPKTDPLGQGPSHWGYLALSYVPSADVVDDAHDYYDILNGPPRKKNVFTK